MSQAPDKESKTEEPTEKKIADAVEKGNVPRSREMSIFASLLGVLTAAALLMGPATGSLFGKMMVLIDNPGAFTLRNGHEANQLMWTVSMEAGRLLVPVASLLAIAGVAASLFQNAPKLALEQIQPKLSRISLAAGWKRIFGSHGVGEFLKAIFKFGAIAFVCVIVLNSQRASIVNAILGDPSELPGIALSLAVRLLSTVCVTIALLVAADVVWTRFKWRADLRMTRQELKDEIKQSEGDPLIKGRLRSLARDRARRRMISAVPDATVIITNPTHYAIALKYDQLNGEAPMVVAKGVDLVALNIREIANRHAVPIVENKPLARAMYDAVEVGQWIPPEFYRAVAKVLHVIFTRQSHVPVG